MEAIMSFILILAHDRHIPYAAGQTLAQTVYLSGFFTPPALCSGLSLCGRCRMRIVSAPAMPEPTDADTRRFSQEELILGWRLGCRHAAQPGMQLELPPDIQLIPPPLPLTLSSASSDTKLRRCQYGLAVDLGTTTLEWALTPLTPPSGDDPLADALWRGSCVNPQMGAGSDVMARLAVARTPEGRAALHTLTANALANLVRTAQHHTRAAWPEADIAALCLAANPAMTALALNLDSAGLAAAPYSLPERGGRWTAVPGLSDSVPNWIPPQLSPFVGGDLAAGYAALALNPAGALPVFPFVLADMGTNGEFLLALSPDKALAASVALGPALEGSGLYMGSEAHVGAISGFLLRPEGLCALILREEDETLRAALAMPGERVCGITGTGYLSLLRLLLHGGVIDEHGHFKDTATGPLQRLLPAAPATENERGGRYLDLPHGLRLCASDIEELLKVKAAFSLGLRRLLAAAGIAAHDLSRICLAGSLGRYVDKQSLETLGFFPPGSLSRLHAMGNSSLAGAALLLRHPPAQGTLKDWAAQVRTVNLAADPEFTGAFAAHMRFSW
jgi:uncharacterized 2Fe-2S/4Fe-4S cluster protein (DUF4445 family)